MSRKARTQQERRSATTQVVLENATNLFGSRGYQATSLEDIAEASGTTIRPVYHYFGNKLNLFLPSRRVWRVCCSRLYLILKARKHRKWYWRIIGIRSCSIPVIPSFDRLY